MSEILSVLNDFANQISGLPFGTIGQYAAASGALAAVTTVPYRYLKKYTDHYKFHVQIVLAIGGTLIATAHYLLTTPTTDSGIIWLQGLAMAAASQPIYIVGKAAVLNFLAGVAKAQALKLQAQSAAVPYGGLPLSSTQPQEVSDFSH